MSDQPDPATNLAQRWQQQLRHSGQVRIPHHSDAERDLYRRAGRKAGRLLNRPVRTYATGQTVIIVLADWMDRPLEHQLEHARARNAINHAFDAPHTQPGDRQPADHRPGRQHHPP